MALTQVYTAVPNDVITAARWNNEFGNIYNNGTTLAFPLTGAVSFAGKTITLDSGGGVTMTASTTTLALTGAFSVSGTLTALSSMNVGTVVPGKYIEGLTYGNNAGDATNDIDIFAGSCADGGTTAASRHLMVLASTLVKRLDASWAVGTNQGGLDTGSIGNSDYYIWLIQRSDTGVVDALFSLSSTAPTMPASYDFKRLIGWFKRVGATIVAFTTYELSGGGLELLWSAPTIDVDLANTLTTARRTDAIKVPLNFSTTGILNIRITDAAALSLAYIYCPDASDQAPSAVVGPGINIRIHVGTVGAVGMYYIRTSATGTIAARADTATVDAYQLNTLGFRWSRR